MLSIVGVSLVTGPASQSASVGASAQLVPSDAVLYLSIDTHFLSPQWVQTTALAQRVNPDADARGIAQSALSKARSAMRLISTSPFVGGEDRPRCISVPLHSSAIHRQVKSLTTPMPLPKG
ncbi:MAG: hypothetical protein R2845_15445 [Thermomicrobiales bacterium]